MWRLLRHPHILEFYDGCVTDDGRWHVLLIELVSGGELFARVQSMGRFEERDAARWVRQTLSAVEYLHAMQVVHRDIKLENILLDAVGYAKLIDFGFAKVIN